MARKPRGGLEYGAAPDLVQPGAPVRQDDGPAVPDRARSSRPGASRSGKSARLEYEPEPFPGARAPAGPSESAQETLRARGLVESTRASEENAAAIQVPARQVAGENVAETPRTTTASRRTTEKPRKPAPAKTRTTTKPSRPPKTTTSAAPRRKSAPKRRTAPAKGGEKRTARTVRLAPNVEDKLQQIAATFGVDLNAAVAVAITHGFKALQDADLVRPVEPGNERVDDR